jgi:small subunit ribosomal protein SAe
MSQFPAVLNASEDDVQKMLACHVHIGTRNLDISMEQYIWKRRSDGIYIIDLKKTWEKLILAARMIVTIQNPQDVVLISARPYGQRAILKFGKFTGAQALAGRYTPGTFTNQIQRKFIEPRILIVNDPRTDHQPLRESAYVNVPAIAFAHTDAQVRYVDCVIPANNKGKNAIGLMYWLLAREVLFLRGAPTCNRAKPWDTMVDLFIYRDPEEIEKEEEAAADQYAFQNQGAAGAGDAAFDGQRDENWNGAPRGAAADWTGDAPAPVSGQPQWDATVMQDVSDWSNPN